MGNVKQGKTGKGNSKSIIGKTRGLSSISLLRVFYRWRSLSETANKKSKQLKRENLDGGGSHNKQKNGVCGLKQKKKVRGVLNPSGKGAATWKGRQGNEPKIYIRAVVGSEKE